MGALWTRLRPLLPALAIVALFTVGWSTRLATRLDGAVTDLKFRLRGPLAPQQAIVIVEIDSASIAAVGRWPWHRDVIARLVNALFAAEAKVVGLDVIFSEPDERTPPALRQALDERGLGALAQASETDPVLAEAIKSHADRLVLGWFTDAPCQPGLDPNCPVTRAGDFESIPASLARFAVPGAKFEGRLKAAKTPVMSAVNVVANDDRFASAAAHAGYVNAFLDADGTIRRTWPVMFAARKPQPSLALEVARVSRGLPLALQVNADGEIASLGFEGAAPLPVSKAGELRVNFHGPRGAFPYVSAERVLAGDAEALAQVKGAIVLVGLSAVGVHDLRSFPFSANVPGVEGHATVVENLLSGTALRTRAGSSEAPVMVLLLVVLPVGLALASRRMGSLGGTLAFTGALAGLAVVDTRLFAARFDYPTGLVYLELLTLFLVTTAVRYVEEERKKKFIREAFAHYVSPAVVDTIIAHPDQLALGGARKTLTVLFSDIRGFTNFSERLDAPTLVAFLNEYLGRMTDVVFAEQGTLDKYIGDAVMAFWGAPVPQEDHAARAVRAALAMLREVEAMRPGVKARWQIELDVGIGITTGEVSVGNMGSKQNLEYTVIGDRVNLASRLESLTKTYGARLLTTRETLSALKDPPPHRLIDLVRVKGKTQAVEVVELLLAPVDPAEGARFEAARGLYLARDWAGARAAFEALNRATPRKLYDLYAARCVHFETTPPSAGWTGEWEMETK